MYESLFRPDLGLALVSEAISRASRAERKTDTHLSRFLCKQLLKQSSHSESIPPLSLSLSLSQALLYELKGCRNLAWPCAAGDRKPDDFHNNPPLVLCARIRTDDSVSLKAAISSPPPGKLEHESGRKVGFARGSSDNGVSFE